MAGNPEGRGIGRLLADFGHTLPTAPSPPEMVRDQRLFRDPVSHRGRRHRDAGWAPSRVPASVWRMTSDQAPALWPFIAGPGLPPTGVQIGVDHFSGGSFYADPVGWTLNDDIPVTNGNVMTFGDPGQGKSGTTKAFALRATDFGYKVLVLGDVKDEYEPLCRHLGVDPITVGQGLPARINPLDFGPLGQGWGTLPAKEARQRASILFARWGTLVRGLVGSQKIGDLHVPFGPTEARVVDSALRTLTGYRDGHSHLSEATIPQLWQLIDNPDEALVADCRYAGLRQFLDETRLLRDALAQLVTGALAGLFDARTTIAVDWQAPIQSLSLSRLKPLGDEAVAIALTCLSSWGRGMRELAAPGELRLTIRDEVWLQLRLGPDAVKSFDADLRLSRSQGEIQWCNMHHPSNFASVGDAGSQSSLIAQDMLKLADTKILHGSTDTGLHDQIGDIGQRIVTDWGRQAKGRALWLVGDRLHKVQTILHPRELELFNTNEALEGALR